MKRTYSPPKIILSRCTGCGICVEACPGFVLGMRDKKASVVRGDWCIGCGHCGAVCPVIAIKHEASSRRKIPAKKSVAAAAKVMQLLRERRSVRLYRRKPLHKKIIQQIIEAGRYAPTGENSQNVCYIVLQSPAKIGELRKMTIAFYAKIFGWVKNRFGAFLFGLFAGRRIVAHLRESIPKLEYAKELIDQGEDCLFYDAPAVLVVHAEAWDTCSAFNGAVALYNCSLMAHTLGVGCCFNGYLQGAINNDGRIRRWLGIPGDHRCFGAMTLGYQAITYHGLAERDPARVAWR
jgi:nitroreductase/NAD-dependent dihydropyrimidine dehydrogenase PreA subunit